MPNLSIFHPDSYSEVDKVIFASNNRNSKDVDFFNKTDISVLYAFKDIVDISKKKIKEIFISSNFKIRIKYINLINVFFIGIFFLI